MTKERASENSWNMSKWLELGSCWLLFGLVHLLNLPCCVYFSILRSRVSCEALSNSLLKMIFFQFAALLWTYTIISMSKKTIELVWCDVFNEFVLVCHLHNSALEVIQYIYFVNRCWKIIQPLNQDIGMQKSYYISTYICVCTYKHIST